MKDFSLSTGLTARALNLPKSKPVALNELILLYFGKFGVTYVLSLDYWLISALFLLRWVHFSLGFAWLTYFFVCVNFSQNMCRVKRRNWAIKKAGLSLNIFMIYLWGSNFLLWSFLSFGEALCEERNFEYPSIYFMLQQTEINFFVLKKGYGFGIRQKIIHE